MPDMPDIRVLPAQLVNKIAAGECIERPASVVKELVENALDAGATRIDVLAEQGGCKLMRVTDNGCGMTPEQLPIAIQAHATSKITDEDDLYTVKTMGFRGEAMASIGVISLLRISSVPKDADIGGKIEVSQGQCTDVVPYAASSGTTVEVHNLFHNTPARRKFLKTPATEFSHIQEQVVKIALTQPKVAFSLQHNARTALDLPAVEDPRDRIADIFGADLAGPLLQVFYQDDAFTLQAYISRPEDAKSSNRWQYTFLNRRPIRDRYVTHALKEAYRGMLSGDRQPVAFIHLDVDPTMVDVNVHPTKGEVRFSDPGQVHSLVLGAIRDRFLSMDMPAPLMKEEPTEQPPAVERENPLRESVTGALADYLKSVTPTSQGSLSFDTHLPGAKASPPRHATASPAAEIEPRRVSEPSAAHTVSGQSAIQIHNSYLVVETDDGFVIIDQHALHERVLYQRLKDNIEAGPIERQRLLVPHVVNLTASQMAQIESIRDDLARVGVEIEVFGPQAIAVHSLPALADNIKADEMIDDLLGRLDDQISPQPTEIVEHIIESIACKAAVKAGDPLSAEEIQSLLEYRENVEAVSTCPHGRPTSLRMTLGELRKKFKRT